MVAAPMSTATNSCYNASQSACKSLILSWFIDFFAQFATIRDAPPDTGSRKPTVHAGFRLFSCLPTSGSSPKTGDVQTVPPTGGALSEQLYFAVRRNKPI